MPTTAFPTEYVVVDVETTGFKPEEGHVIIEVAAQRIHGSDTVDQYTSLVTADRPLHPDNVKFNGIDDNLLLREGKSPLDVFPILREFLQNSVLIGHNVPFDIGFMNAHFKKHQLALLDNQTLDTLDLSRRYLILPSYSLESVARYLKVPQSVAHRALADVETTRLVFLKLVERAAKVGR
ncbi:MAG: 3'-5' exonuclease [Candidatus Kerfeldbacteria bacterium]